MAKKRMFSTQIVDSDAFIDMPVSSQLLYFHLVMRADDEGFVGNPKKIMRMVNVSDDDFKILVAKRFILSFQSGVVVIKHWLIHNAIRMDRFSETAYQDEKKLIMVKENKGYTEIENSGNQMATIGCPKRSEAKLSEAKLSEEKDTYGEFKNVKLTKEEYQKLVDKITDKNTHILIEELSGYLASTPKRYASHYATLLNWARRKYQDNQRSNKPKRTIA